MSQPQNQAFIRRSVLFMPGDSLPKITKASQLDVDSIVMDLEDGVALNRKEEARQTVTEAMKSLVFGHRERLIRLNPLTSDFFQLDLARTVGAQPDGYVVPKVETAAQIQAVSAALAEVESAQGWPPESIRLLAVVETALGLMNVGQIAQASARLDALMFGAEDLAGNIGAKRTLAAWEVFYARSAVVTAAAAFGLQAIDMIFTDFKNLEDLEQDCIFARHMGYDGKMAIHPAQLEPIHRIFSPSAEEIKEAQALIQAYQDHQTSGVGAFALNGAMVDRPMIRLAERVLAKAKAARLL